MQGAWWIVQKSVTRWDDDHAGLDRGHAGTLSEAALFARTGEAVSPCGPMERGARFGRVTRMLNAAPMAWTAMVLTPCPPYGDGDVTVLLRVTYNTLEAIILDQLATTESRVTLH